MPGRGAADEFAEGLSKAAREAYDEITNLAKTPKAKAPRKKGKGPAGSTANRGAKHWSGNAVVWAPQKQTVKDPTKEETKSLRYWANKKGKGTDNSAKSSVDKNFKTALLHDRLRPIKAALQARGFPWGKFKLERMAVDPNLSKLGKRARQERLADLWDELGEEGFYKRFNI